MITAKPPFTKPPLCELPIFVALRARLSERQLLLIAIINSYYQ